MPGTPHSAALGLLARTPPIALLLIAATGCSHLAPGAYVDRRMGEATPTATAIPTATPTPTPTATPTPVTPSTPLRLSALLDLALSSDPATRAAWHEARAAAATAGARRADWLPALDASGVLQKRDEFENVAPGVRPTTASASARLSWLLLDLGERSAAGSEAELELTAARLAHEVAAQDLALEVEVTWFQYQAARALVDAAAATQAQADTSLAAAEARQRAGAATMADVLQARTARSQARLDAQRTEGQVLALRGALATLAGLPATTPLEVAPLPERLPADPGLPEVERLLQEAAARNPDLARARAQAGAAGARADAAARARLPTLSATASAGELKPVRPEGSALQAWSAGLVLDVPLFDGGRTTYQAAAARERAAAAQARADQAGRRVQLDAWTSLQALRTAGHRVEGARDLLASASAGVEVAAARYREGVGSILDLLAAQNALAVARAEDILARADWLVAVARLARATGRALPDTDGAAR